MVLLSVHLHVAELFKPENAKLSPNHWADLAKLLKLVSNTHLHQVALKNIQKSLGKSLEGHVVRFYDKTSKGLVKGLVSKFHGTQYTISTTKRFKNVPNYAGTSKQLDKLARTDLTELHFESGLDIAHPDLNVWVNPALLTDLHGGVEDDRQSILSEGSEGKRAKSSSI